MFGTPPWYRSGQHQAAPGGVGYARKRKRIEFGDLEEAEDAQEGRDSKAPTFPKQYGNHSPVEVQFHHSLPPIQSVPRLTSKPSLAYLPTLHYKGHKIGHLDPPGAIISLPSLPPESQRHDLSILLHFKPPFPIQKSGLPCTAPRFPLSLLRRGVTTATQNQHHDQHYQKKNTNNHTSQEDQEQSVNPALSHFPSQKHHPPNPLTTPPCQQLQSFNFPNSSRKKPLSQSQLSIPNFTQ